MPTEIWHAKWLQSWPSWTTSSEYLNQSLLPLAQHLKVSRTCNQNVCRTETCMSHSQSTAKFKVAVTFLISLCTLFLILCLNLKAYCSCWFLSTNTPKQTKTEVTDCVDRNLDPLSHVSPQTRMDNATWQWLLQSLVLGFSQILAISFTSQATTVWNTIARPSQKGITSYVSLCL